MNIKEVKYAKVFNLGNYETERIEFTAEVAADEEAKSVLEKLKGLVEAACVDGHSSDQTLSGFIIKTSTGELAGTFEHPNEWLKTFSDALPQAQDPNGFVNNNLSDFLRVKELAEQNPNPRVLERVQDIEARATELARFIK